MYTVTEDNKCIRVATEVRVDTAEEVEDDKELTGKERNGNFERDARIPHRRPCWYE
jgi:hypothetical protein